ncbi:helix-turn-helix transcriptional regulator [Pseudomonas sp. R1-18]|uniref:helix-turn-helix transcriptional regulator n=1 Tax=Pseudomonas sp. R1-18 TaxID=1632772 RepID=UPI003DA94A32
MNHVRTIRKHAGITQAQLRRALGWNQSRVANYESGLRRPGLSDARQIVAALNLLGARCSLDDVFPPARKSKQSDRNALAASGPPAQSTASERAEGGSIMT